MIIPVGIEGDYLETKKTHLFFDIKGLHHPNDRKICFIRFYQNKNGDRVKNNIRYKKIYDLEERYSFLKANFPQYIFFSKNFDMELQSVKNEDIKHIYTPRSYYQSLINKENLSQVEKTSKSLCELFIDKGGIASDSIGITGSQMVGLNREISDIDLIIYGTENSLKFQKTLKHIFETSNKCRMYNKKEYKKHYNWRVGGSDIPFHIFLQSEMRKLHQGKYQDIDFFIRYVKSSKDWKGNYYDYEFKNLGRIHLEAEITDSTDSIFTPCSYKIEPLKIISSPTNQQQISLNRINEVCSFRGRFCEQAVKDEIVLIKGKLEKVKFKDEKEYFRILLENQIKDKMMILT